LLKASRDRIAAKLNPAQKRFAVEVIGTFIVVVLATGSVVIDAKFGGRLGVQFIAFAPFVGVAIGVYLFGKISMAHFNPAVTLGFLTTGHITKLQLLQYFAAEITGALLASLFVMSLIGTEASLGANAPDYSYPLIGIWNRNLGYCYADGSHLLSSVHQRFERFGRSGYRSDGRS
jgi:aquaporin Z